MNTKHPTEEELQDYLDGSSSARNIYVEKHIKTCQVCRNTLKEYERLYAELKVDKGFELSPNFSESVLARLPKEEVSKSRIGYTAILIAGISILVIFSTAIYLFNWKWFIQTLSGISFPYFKTILTSGRLIGGFFTNLNIDVSLLLISALILLIVGLLDQIFFSKKHKLISFFQVIRIS